MQIIDLVPDLRPTILAARQMRDERNSLSRWLPHRAVQAVSYKHGRRRRVDQTVPIRGLDTPAVPIRRPGLGSGSRCSTTGAERPSTSAAISGISVTPIPAPTICTSVESELPSIRSRSGEG